MLLGCLIGCAGAGAAHGAPVAYQFAAFGFEGGGILSGSFIGEDLNSDGILASSNNEISLFEYSFLGDSLVPDVALSQSDFNTVFDFNYNFANNPGVLGDDTNEGLLLVSTDVNNNFLDTFLANCQAIAGCDAERTWIGQNGDGLTDNFSGSFNNINITVSNVPVPASLLLFSTALVGLISGRQLRKS